jgi:deoxyribodipyrimidine photo-lyase
MQIDSRIPEEIERLAGQARVLVRRGGAPRREGKCVVYWMQRAMRVLDNAALDVAVEAGNLLGLPVVVFYSVSYANWTLRHFQFMAQGVQDVVEDAAERGLGFVLRRSPDHSVATFAGEVEAALVVGDENACREQERWRRVVASQLKVPFWTVDADVVVPSRVFGRTYFLMHHFRPHWKAELGRFLVKPAKVVAQREWKPRKGMESFAVERDLTAGFKKVDRRFGPAESFTGGTRAAVKRMREFVRDGLADYERARNHPEVKGTSRLSPYLRFGNIGPLTIALAVEKAVKQGKATAAASERFLEQLIGWRELSVLFVRHTPEYDNWESAEPWARKTLVEHAGDTRPQRYSLAQMERGETGDELWNAAQREMVDTGWMHNYMRMYWAKKILEWAPDAARAYEWAVKLNDRYELDGRDPNGYAGIAWAIVGKHDRPWFKRPVYGLVRPMSGASLEKKIDAAAYIRQNGGGGVAL